MPNNIDLLITHGPPFEILDQGDDGIHAGRPQLPKKVTEINPKAHIFGHVHHSYGRKTVG